MLSLVGWSMLILGGVALVGWIASSAGRKRDEAIGLHLYHALRRYWTEPPVWVEVDNDPGRWWDGELKHPAHDALQRIGFRHLGFLSLQDAKLRRWAFNVLSIFVDATSTTTAAVSTPDAEVVVQFETCLSDGRVITTCNNDVKHPPAEPAGIDVAYFPGLAVDALASEHETRLRSALQTQRSEPRVFNRLANVAAEQRHQWERRQSVRLTAGLISREEFLETARSLSAEARERAYAAFLKEHARDVEARRPSPEAAASCCTSLRGPARAIDAERP